MSKNTPSSHKKDAAKTQQATESTNEAKGQNKDDQRANTADKKREEEENADLEQQYKETLTERD
jgi:hypothetical protein